MWLVVYKQDHYPSVFEFEDYNSAFAAYEKIKLIESDNSDGESMKYGRVYIANVDKSFGDHDENVEWYVSI